MGKASKNKMSLCDIFPDDPSCAEEVDPNPVDVDNGDGDGEEDIDEEVIDDGEAGGVEDEDDGKPSRSRRASSLPPKKFWPRNRPVALDSTKKLASASRPLRPPSRVNTSTRSAPSRAMCPSAAESSRALSSRLK